MMRQSYVMTLWTLLAISLCLVAGRTLAAEEKSNDLSKIQGSWEWRAPVDSPAPIRTEVKQINGDREVVTSYDKDGKVLAAHAVEVKLTDQGGVKVFTFSKWEYTDGPQKGQKLEGPNGYVYRATADVFTEISGLLPGQEEQPVVARTWVKKPTGPENEASKKELEAWQGTWRPSEGRPFFFIVKSDEASMKDKDGKTLIRGVLRADASKNPKTFDLIFFESLGSSVNGLALHGLYELKGDEMKWCYIQGTDAKRRPDAMAPAEGRMMPSYKRDK